MSELSILIPSRNEMFLAKTVEDLLSNIEADTDIIIGLDGAWADPPITDHPKVKIIHYSESIGQRAITNKCAKISDAKYLCKVDAHCAFDKGFDRKMLDFIKGHDDWTVVPIMRNLHAFDWVCPDGHRRYQGPSGPCKECGKETSRDVCWIPKTNPQSTSYRFDKDLHFQYFNEFKNRPEGQGEATESMSLQGSFFMLTADKYWELNICDEGHGGWGQQGTEVACKTWLSGGKVMCNHNTWYAHMFRTQGGDFGFPYPLSGHEVQKARDYSKNLFLNGQWDKAIHNIEWLVDRFKPVPDWTIPSREILYYTYNINRPKMIEACRQQLLKANLPITSVSLNEETGFGNTKLVMQGEPGPLTMHKQIVMGLEKCKADFIFLAEHDVLYPPSHFNFIPPRKDVFYFDTNCWKIRDTDGHMVWTDDIQQLSGMMGSREILLEFFKKRVEQIEKEGFNRHYEPSERQNVFPYAKGGKYGQVNYQAPDPMLDIRHGGNASKTKWSVEEYRNKEFAKGWKEADEVSFWGVGKEIIKQWQ